MGGKASRGGAAVSYTHLSAVIGAFFLPLRLKPSTASLPRVPRSQWYLSLIHIFYTRLANPTNDAVAAKIAELEGGAAAMLTSSGQAANFFAVFNIAGAGDHVVASSAIYGGTYNLLAHTMGRMGLECTFVDPHCTDEELKAAFRPNTKCVFGETIANPALAVLDIERFAAAAHGHGVPLIVDNTFPTPVLCLSLIHIDATRVKAVGPLVGSAHDDRGHHVAHKGRHGNHPQDVYKRQFQGSSENKGSRSAGRSE